MRKHFAEYVSGMENATELRSQLVHTNSSREAYDIVRPFLDEPFDIDAHLSADPRLELSPASRETLSETFA